MTRLVGVSTQVMISMSLAWITLMQYDNVSEVLGVNTRLHWIPKAGQEGFIVLEPQLPRLRQECIVSFGRNRCQREVQVHVPVLSPASQRRAS